MLPRFTVELSGCGHAGRMWTTGGFRRSPPRHAKWLNMMCFRLPWPIGAERAIEIPGNLRIHAKAVREVEVQTLLQDLRYAVRQLRKSPGFTLAAVITLAIGIGSNVAIFSSMDAVVLRPLAVPELNRVVTLAEQRDRGDYQQVALANYQDWASQSRSFEDLAVRKSVDMSLTGSGDAAHVPVAMTSATFFPVLPAQPVLGRVFGQRECRAGQNAVAVLNYGFWQRR